MLNQKDNSSDTNADTSISAALIQKERINQFQIRELHKEIENLNSRLSLIPEPIFVICKRFKELWWTVSKLLGWGWLHDGSRITNPNLDDKPNIALSTTPLVDMPSPRLFLDVTDTYKSKLNTGVQRVIREICRNGVSDGSLAPIIIHKDRFVTLPDFVPVPFQSGDQILLLDSGWTLTCLYPSALKFALDEGARCVLGIHDLIPLQHPGFVKPYFTSVFNEWLRTIAPYCSAAIAVSQYSAKSFEYWLQQNLPVHSIHSIGWFQLGANFPKNIPTNKSHEQVSKNQPVNYLLSVGTIEPRKGYSVALDAFDSLWQGGSNLSYVIIGRRGELSAHLIGRIQNHQEFMKRLFWFEYVTDDELAEYYQNSIGLIFPSLAEGFGLPLVEAAYYQKPIIASDLPVFKEVASSGAAYFSTGSSEELIGLIIHVKNNASTNSGIKFLDWKTATDRMIQVIKDNSYQIVI